MAKKTTASKKRNVRVDAIGQLHIHSSFNNIIVSLAKQSFVQEKLPSWTAWQQPSQKNV